MVVLEQLPVLLHKVYVVLPVPTKLIFGVNVYCPVVEFNTNVPVVVAGCVTVNVGLLMPFAPVSFPANVPVVTVFCGVEIGSVTANGAVPVTVYVIVVLEQLPVLLHKVYVVLPVPTKLVFGVNVYCPVVVFNTNVPVVVAGCVTVYVGLLIALAPVSFPDNVPVVTVFCGVEIGSVTANGAVPVTVIVIIAEEQTTGEPLHNV